MQAIDKFVSDLNRLIVNPLIVFIFGLAVVYFLYGVFQFLSNQENEEKKTAGKSHMMWGIIGIVIMMAVFSILNIIMNTFDIEGINPQGETVNLPPYNPPTANTLHS